MTELTSGLPAPPLRTSVARLARSAAELASLAAVLSFALSAWVNQRVFDSWGLNFLQIATLADVIMSGLHLLFWGLIPLLTILAVGFGMGRLRGRARWIKRAVLALAAATLVLAISISSVTEEAGSLAVAAGALLVGLLLPGALHARQHPSRGGRVRQFFVLALAIASLAGLVRSTILGVEEAGYGGRRALHSATPTIAGCSGHVLWSGERALVLSCAKQIENQIPTRVMVIHQPENWAFATDSTTQPPQTRP